jgi:bacterioferritin (cytochrome b1)
MLENKIADELNERLEQQLKNKLKNFLHTLILPNTGTERRERSGASAL